MKAAAKNREYDPDFFKTIGRRGGKVSRGGGFSSDIVGEDGLTGKERASAAGRKGGKAGRRGKAKLGSNFIPAETYEAPKHISLLKRMHDRFGL